MPRRKSLKTVIAEILMFVGVFAIVGHLCENLYERFMMQSELANMKSELNILGMSMSNIESEYDALRGDIENIVYTNNADTSMHLCNPICESYIVSKPVTSVLANTVVTGICKLADAETNYKSETKDFMQNFDRRKKDFMQVCTVLAKDKSTVTEGRAVKYAEAGNSRDDIEDLKKIDICKCIEKFMRLEIENINREMKHVKDESSLSVYNSTPVNTTGNKYK